MGFPEHAPPPPPGRFYDTKVTKAQQMTINIMNDVGVSENFGYPQIIHFNRVFHYKPSIWGTTIFGNTYILYHVDVLTS